MRSQTEYSPRPPCLIGLIPVIEFRPFLNTDPPLIVDVWKQQPVFRGQISSISRDLLDLNVLAKPYFDRHGLIVAVDTSGDQPRPLGFVHAGFPPREDLSDLDLTEGVISQLKLVPGDQQAEVSRGLLDRACEYLAARGAKKVHVGSRFPFAPFYLGIYGGSRIPGVMADDKDAVTAYQQYGFEFVDKIIVLERRLSSFKTIVDRRQMTLRRQFVISADGDPLERSWWESCTLGHSDRDRFAVTGKTDPKECGRVSYWDVEPLASQWGIQTRGLYDLAVLPELHRTGVATFLVGESLRHLMQQGVGLVEVQAPESDAASLGVFGKLGFQPVGEGLAMSKSLAG